MALLFQYYNLIFEKSLQNRVFHLTNESNLDCNFIHKKKKNFVWSKFKNFYSWKLI